MTRSVVTCAAVVAAAAACGCAGSDPEPAADVPTTDLTVRFTHPRRPEVRIRCDGAAARCDRTMLERVRGALRQRARRDVACTEIYGGPQRATVSGTLAGERVAATFTRVDGCAIAAYDALLRALGAGPDPLRVVVPERDATPPEARIELAPAPGAAPLGQAAQPPGGARPAVVELDAPRLVGTTIGHDRNGGVARVRVSITERITCSQADGSRYEKLRVRYYPPPQIERIRSTPGTPLPVTARRLVRVELGRRCGAAVAERVRGELWGEAINGSGLEAVTPHIRFDFRGAEQ